MYTNGRSFSESCDDLLLRTTPTISMGVSVLLRPKPSRRPIADWPGKNFRAILLVDDGDLGGCGGVLPAELPAATSGIPSVEK